jgi:hypothetical protein
VFVQHIGLLVGLCAISVVLWWRVWVTGDPTSSISCQCGDPAQYMWLIEWVPWSILHLHDPFLSQAIYAGQGGSNTLELSDLLPSLVVSPLTLLFGPVLAFNTLVTLVPVLNGWSFFLFARKVSGFLPGQLIGSMVYGFSPYVLHDDPFGHFNIDLVFFPPLVLWCLYDLLVQHRHKPAHVGLSLSALCVAQYFTGTEMLAMAAVVGLCALPVVFASAPRLLGENLRRLAPAAAVAIVVSGVVLAYPLWFALDGPRHVTGYPWPGTPYFGVPTTGILGSSSFGPVPTLGIVAGYFGNLGASTAYLGVVMLFGLLVLSALWWRRRLAWCLAAAGFAGWALSLGLQSGAGGSWTPWRLFYRLPLVSDILPGRFAVFSDLAAAGLIVLALDACWSQRAELAWRMERLRVPARLATVMPVAGWCLGSIVMLVPIAARYRLYNVHDNPVPAWFVRQAAVLPAGEVVLAMPVATSGVTQAMAWQADAKFRFAMIGGEAQVPGSDGVHSIHVDPPAGTLGLLDALSWGIGPDPDVDDGQVAAARGSLVRWGVNVVVVTDQTRFPGYAVAVLAEITGRLPMLQDGSWVWYGIGSSAPIELQPTVLRACARDAVTPMGAAACVIAAAG